MSKWLLFDALNEVICFWFINLYIIECLLWPHKNVICPPWLHLNVSLATLLSKFGYRWVCIPTQYCGWNYLSMPQFPRISMSKTDPGDPFYKHGLTLTLTWISNCIHYKMWDEIKLSIPKLQQLHWWSFGIDKYVCTILHNGCNYLSMLGLKLIHVSKRVTRSIAVWSDCLFSGTHRYSLDTSPLCVTDTTIPDLPWGNLVTKMAWRRHLFVGMRFPSVVRLSYFL